MRSRFFAVLAIAALTFSAVAAGHADPDPRVQDVLNALNRFPPGTPGETRHVTLLYGPYVVQPGVDRNLITLDVPVQTGFYTSVQPSLIDVTTGEEPTEQQAHIHHAHWFRVTSGGNYEYYQPVAGSQGLSWVFGTGEERSGGTLTDRQSRSEGYQYGIFLDGKTPQTLIFMIHNKQALPLSAYITLDIDMMYGTRDEIHQATGKDIHPLLGVLTGTTQNVLADTTVDPLHSNNAVLTQDYTADFSGTLVASASHMHPGGKWVYVTNLGPKLPDGHFACENTDVNVPGIPGTVLFISKKSDQVSGIWPYSEDYQMGATQGGFRAPIHKGDVIRQYGVYDVKRTGDEGVPSAVLRSDPMNSNSSIQLDSVDHQQHGWYAAMSYTGLYADPDNNNFPLAGGITDSSQCTKANFAPKLLSDVGGFNYNTTNPVYGESEPWSNNPLETHITHPWNHIDPVCGAPDPSPNHTGTYDCDSNHVAGRIPVASPIQFVDGQATDTIRAAAFAYLPGDMNIRNPLDGTLSVPLVKMDSTLHLVNADVAMGVRHTFTSCELPCDGPYVANYPTPDGHFDSGKLGNLDYIDGGLVQSDGNSVTLAADASPLRDIQVDSLHGFTAADALGQGGLYAYFCSIHPWMRGFFKVVR